MYKDFKFAEHAKVEVFTDAKEALQRSFDITVNPVPAVVEEIQVTADGKIVFRGEQKSISLNGMESFLKILSIPPLFARKLPTDLLLYNIDKLIKDSPAKPIFVLERPNNNIASIVQDPYTEIPYNEVIGRFIERPVKNIELSESLLKMTFVFDTLKVPDLDDSQDTLYIGEYLVSSLTKLTSLQAIAGLYRTQCSNSFIMPILGKLKANYMKKEDVRLLRFADAFECYDQNLVATVFRNFVQKKQGLLYEHQVKQIWERIAKVFSKSDADQLFSFDDDSRNAILSNARGYLSEVKKAKNLNLVPPEATTTPFQAYKIANDVTTSAHTRMYDIVDQVHAETVGGTILQWMLFSNN